MDLARELMAHAPIEPGAVHGARMCWSLFRQANGYSASASWSDQPILTPPTHNTKLAKTGKAGTVVYGLALAPADLSGMNVCRYSTPECRKGCVAFAGKGELPSVIKARQLKTRFLQRYPNAFVTLLDDEISRAKAKHGEVAVRLNTFSDLPWEVIAPWLFTKHADVAFYDYTKWSERVTPANYSLTFSVSERTSDEHAAFRAETGANVAVIFGTKKGQALPETWQGVPVVDGDVSDARHLDPTGVVVGLRAKGRMRTGHWAMVRNG